MLAALRANFAWLGILAEVKFAAVLLVSFSVCLLTYESGVRSAAIGLMLHGRRYPQGLAD